MVKLNTAIRGVQIDTNVAGNGLEWDGSDNLQVDLDGATLSVGASGVKITTGGVSATELATDAVETLKIKDKNVTVGKMADMGLEAHILVADASLRPVSVAVSGDITINALGAVAIASGVIINADVKSDAAIAMSKLDLAITNSEVAADAAIALDKIVDMATTKIMIGSGAGNAEYALSGDATMTNAGVVSVTDLTITSEATGDLIYFDGTNWIRLADSASAGYVLTSDAAGGLSWTAKSSVTEDYIQEAEIQKAVYAGDDSTTVFSIGSAAVANSVQVFLEGMLAEEGSGNDYTLAGTDITFATAPEDGMIIQLHSIKT